MEKQGRFMPEKKGCFINFAGEVNQNTVNQLIQTVNERLKQDFNQFTLLISSGGGYVAPGITAYNFLKGIPAKVITHNYGSADSIAVILFCAGAKRICAPNARFLLHGVGFNVTQPIRFEEKQLDERIKSLKIDRENIAKIIAENCKKTQKQVEHDLFEVKVLNPDEAKKYGLVHEIKAHLFFKGAEVINILQ